ncbi:MAG: lipase family protein [Actinomycetota bacterium]|nr:lipase family protein [Actinomycetota bacterium]
MRRFLATLATASLLFSPLPALGGDGYSWPGDAPYSVPKQKMTDALECHSGNRLSRHGAGALNGRGRKHPVLLVHGTFVNRETNWKWNYWETLHEKGWEVCWVNLPNGSLGDIQVSSEYVAHALKLMHRASGEKIDVLGHSQGGLQPRWAIKWFAAGRFVADYIALATPNHGTSVSNDSASNGRCFESCWQMRRNSNFLGALNRTTETPGPIFYTSIYTQTDELVQPTGTQALKGASNILIQDVCPGRSPDHVLIAGDYVTWVLVRDALLSPGPADPEVVETADCSRLAMPGSETPPAEAYEMVEYDDDDSADREPPLKRYARP